MNETVTDNPQDAVRVTLGSSEFTVIAGKSVEIEVFIANPGPSDDFFEVNLLGIPSSWIVYSGPSAIWISAGGQEKVVLTVCPPVEGEEVSGYYPGHVRVIRQSEPDRLTQQEVLLSILPGEKRKQDEVELGAAAFQSMGRVGVTLKSVQFATGPGASLEIPLTVLNRGLEPDTFSLYIEGIVLSWVSTSTPVIQLEPGENKEVTLVVQPPLSPSSKAGRYKFRLIVTSQGYPDQAVKIDCTLTVAAYTLFSAELEPLVITAGQPVKVTVKNEGNIQQVFHLTCLSQNDQLTFEFLQPVYLPSSGLPAEGNRKADTGVQPGAPQNPQSHTPAPGAGEQAKDFTTLTISPGESAAFRFSARPRQRSLIGGEVSYPYQASVGAKQKEALTLPGQVTSKGMIPAWVLPIALLLCLCLVFSSSFLLLQGGFQTNSATQTSVAGTAVAAGATQTLLAITADSAGATQTIAANQTAAAVAGQQDTDGDGLTDQRETEIGTNPYNPDTDGDGLMDGEEVFQTGTNPFNPDSDMDGLRDGDEIRLRTNPLNADTDGDKSKDGDEVRLGTNPLDPDTDRDGLVDGGESPPCPNPLNPDSDQDGMIDGRDLSPCDPNNPALTATAAALLPTATTAPPTAAPTQQPSQVPTPPPPQPSLPRFPGMVLFDSDRDGNPEIYTVDNAGHIKRLTNSPSADVQGAWGPGLRQVVFTSNRDGQNEIYLMNADGSNLVNLTNNPADDQQPAWSIDGQWIAFTSNRGGNYEIYILQLSNFEIRNLTNNPGNDTQPNWLRSTTMDASGESIVFTSDRDGNLEIYRMKTDGAEPVNLTANPASDQMAKGSKDGALLMFTTNRDGNQEIYTMGTDGKGLANLTNHPANDGGPSWSPDDVWAAFTTNRDGNNEVYLLTRPGMPELYNLTHYPGNDQAADWR